MKKEFKAMIKLKNLVSLISFLNFILVTTNNYASDNNKNNVSKYAVYREIYGRRETQRKQQIEK